MGNAADTLAVIYNCEDTGIMRFIHQVSVLLAFAFLLSFLALGQTRRADSFILTIEQVKRSVVPVLCGKFDGSGQFGAQQIEGTGFFVDDQGHFLTAGHVIRDLKVIAPQQPLPCVPAIDIPIDGWNREAAKFQSRWFKFTEADCVINDTLDLAVCKPILPIPFQIYPLFLKDTKPSDGFPVAFTGFPLGNPEPLSSRCNIATYRAASDAEGSRELVLDKGSWPGASGSPIYDEDGNVLAIMLQRGISDGVGISVGRPSHFIIKFLRDDGISVKTTEDRTKKHKKK